MNDPIPSPESDTELLLDALASGEISDEQLDALDALLARNTSASRKLAQQVLDTLIICNWMKAEGDAAFVKATAERVAGVKRSAEKQFVEDTMQRLRNVAGTEATSKGNPKNVASFRRPKYVFSGLIALATAACVFLALRMVFAPTPHESTDPTNAKLIAAEQTTGRDGKALSPGAGLSAGDAILTGDSGSAQIGYSDGTQIKLRARTELALLKQTEHKDSKRLELRSGEIEADIAPQNAAAPAVLITPQAQIVVIGTKFILSVADGATRVEMQKGVVKMARRDGTESRDVVESQVATIDEKQPGGIRHSRVKEGLLALYEFRDGAGDVATDTSGVSPRADLKRAPDGKIQWSPDGLILTTEHAMSTGAELFAKSDGALTNRPRYTVEIWSYLPDKSADEKRSLHLAHFGLTGVDGLKVTGKKHAITAWWNPGLRHTVEVFDENGTYTTYDNGVASAAPSTNDTDAKLLLPRLNGPNSSFALCAAAWYSGQRPKLRAPFAVTYRMVAIYNRPLTAEEVRRNYNAGPTPWSDPSAQ